MGYGFGVMFDSIIIYSQKWFAYRNALIEKKMKINNNKFL